VTTTEESGDSIVTRVDVLGRLTNVWEDPSGLNYETDYQYDHSGNFWFAWTRKVRATDNTKWRTRLFTYDSLSQLTDGE